MLIEASLIRFPGLSQWRIKVLPMPSDFGKSFDEMSETIINPV
jgi:hypothetical protein